MKRDRNQQSASGVSREMRRLVDEFLSGNLSRSDFARLEEMMEEDKANRDYYILASSIESLIPIASESLDVPIEGQVTTIKVRSFLKVLAAAAAVIFVAGSVSLFLLRESTAPAAGDLVESQGVVLDDAISVVWADPLNYFELGQEIDRRLDITAGVVRMTYANGVMLIIEGPASFEVTGTNSGKLNFGSLVADVPPAGKGFVLDHGDERLIDHGTQFGVKLLDEGGDSEVAVFKGEIEIFLQDGSSTRMVEGHAVRMGAGEIQSIPVKKGHFLREFPSREFPWKMPQTAQGTTVEMEFDVSRLVSSDGEYRCLFKWMRGEDRLLIDRVQLWCNDVLISEDLHEGSTGDLRHTFDNIYSVTVDASSTAGSVWKLKSRMRTAPPSDGLPQIAESEGVVFFHPMPDNKLTESAYIGKWGYWHDGVEWIRDFKEGGTMTLYREGEESAHGEWKFRDDFLEVFFPASNATERVYLHQPGRLVFVERPFSDAHRLE